MKLHLATTLAERIQRELAPFCHKCEIAGSIRRARPEVNDIDLVIVPKAGQERALRDRIKAKTRVITDGRQTLIVSLSMPRPRTTMDLQGWQSEFQLDVWFAHGGKDDLLDPQPSNFGSLLLCRTGSKEHNIKICQRAKSMDMKWNPQVGLFAGGVWVTHPEIEDEYVGGKLIASESEEQIFSALGLNWISPAFREAGFSAGPSIQEILRQGNDSQGNKEANVSQPASNS